MTTSGPWSEARARSDAATAEPWDTLGMARLRLVAVDALDAIDAVLALHAQCTEWDDDGELVVVPAGETFCAHCIAPWPCPTVRALGVTE